MCEKLRECVCVKEKRKKRRKESREGPFERGGMKQCVCQWQCRCVCQSGCVKKAKKFQRRESNPRLKRERLECYRLHHIGFYLVMEVQVA